MRTPDVGTNRGAEIKFRVTAEEAEMLDEKRGSTTRSAWLRAAIAEWNGPGSDEKLVEVTRVPSPTIPAPASAQFSPEPGSPPAMVVYPGPTYEGKAADLPKPPIDGLLPQDDGHEHKVLAIKTWVKHGVLTEMLRCTLCGRTKEYEVKR